MRRGGRTLVCSIHPHGGPLGFCHFEGRGIFFHGKRQASVALRSKRIFLRCISPFAWLTLIKVLVFGRYPQHTHILCSQRRCSWAIISSFLLPLLVCSPSYMVFSVRETRVREKGGYISLYHLDLSDMAKENGEFLYVLNFWVYAVLIKLLPCLMLTIIRYVYVYLKPFPFPLRGVSSSQLSRSSSHFTGNLKGVIFFFLCSIVRLQATRSET